MITALRLVWAVMDAPAGKRMAPFLGEIVARLRACGELLVDDDTAGQLSRMSAATIDRRLAADRKALTTKGRSGAKPRSLLKSQIPIRTWADWDDAEPGFVEIDCVGHEGGNPAGDFCQTFDVTDIVTGWTEVRAVQSKAQRWVFAAPLEITAASPFPVKGIGSDNGSQFINAHLLRHCTEHKITLTRSRAGRKNHGAHVEQNNWSVVRQAVGYYRYGTPAELALLNEIYTLLRLSINFFTRARNLTSKTRIGAKVIKKYDLPQTPYQRVLADLRVDKKLKTALAKQYATLNPAQLRRDILTLNDQLLKLNQAKHQPRTATPHGTRHLPGIGT